MFGEIYSGGQNDKNTSIFTSYKNGFKSVISIFCCSVSVNIYLPLIVIMQWDFCLTTASAPHRDLIWSDHQSVWNDMKKQNKLRWTQSEELCQCLQDASRNLPAKLPEKLCASAPRAKAALNAKDAHTKCWFNLVNRSYLLKKIYLWHYFWKHPHFTALLHKSLKLLTVL